MVEQVYNDREYTIAKSDSLAWKTTAKTGLNYLLDAKSQCMLGLEVFYTCVDEHGEQSYLPQNVPYLLDGSVATSTGSSLHTAGVRLGVERNLCDKVVGRFGVYYLNTVCDDWPLFSPNPAETVGIAVGFGYSPIKNLRIDVGADLPFVDDGVAFADRATTVSDVQQHGGPLSFHSSTGGIVYRAGINLAYFF